MINVWFFYVFVYINLLKFVRYLLLNNNVIYDLTWDNFKCFYIACLSFIGKKKTLLAKFALLKVENITVV